MNKKQKQEYQEMTKATIDAALNGKITANEAERLQKVIRQSRRFAFLESKLRWINWTMVVSWLLVMGIVGWEVSGEVEFAQILALVVNGLALLIPVVFVAEGVAIYRAMKVNVRPEEIMEMLNTHQKG